MTIRDMQDEVAYIVENGDDAALRDFFVENFQDLPEEMQKKTLMALFEDALEKEAQGGEIAIIQDIGADAVEAIEGFKAALAAA